MGTIGVIDINPTRTAHGKPTTRQIAALIPPVRASAGRVDEGRGGKKRRMERESRFLSRRTSGRLIFVILRFEIWAQP